MLSTIGGGPARRKEARRPCPLATPQRPPTGRKILVSGLSFSAFPLICTGNGRPPAVLLCRAPQEFPFHVCFRRIDWGMGLQSEHERYLTEKHVKRPVIVLNYPKEIKAFYMRVNDDGRTVAAMDVLAPGIGEIIGGSQREERLDLLDARMAGRGIDKDHYGWYRDLRHYGTFHTPVSVRI